MKDRQPTQILDNGAIRYGVYDAAGQLLRYEYMKREDAPTVEGTPLNKANLLSDTTVAKIWRSATKPEDPTVNDALGRLADGTARVGDISLTVRPAPSANWLPCDGREISEADYPELFSVLRTSVTQDSWTIEVVDSSIPASGSTSPSGSDFISYANGTWFRSRTAHTADDDNLASMWYSTDGMQTWKKVSALPSDTRRVGYVYWYAQKYVCISTWHRGLNYNTCPILYADSPAGPWTRGPEIIGSTISAHDIITDGSTYYVVCDDCIFYTQNILGTWNLLNIQYLRKAVYNPADEYFYAAASSSSTSASFLNLIRTRNLSDKSSWQTLYSPNQGGSFKHIGVDGNLIIGCWFDGGPGSALSNYVYSTDGGATMHVAAAPHAIDQIICQDGIVVAWGHKYATETTSETPVIMITDDITQGFTVVEADTYVDSLSGNNAGLIVGACRSGSGSVRNIWHDFSHANKKIPNITPDSRSHAYIKAAEE